MENNIIKLARSEIINMSAFSSARSLKIKGNIWLDANESPWNDTIYNRYPEPQPDVLLSIFSAIYGVNADQLLISRGSDEGVDLLIRLFCRAYQDDIMICPPTYGMYKIAATIQGASTVEVPLLKENNFSLNIDAILKKWKPNVKLIFLCSPNNPTGNSLKTEDILFLCQALENKSLIVIDEAYIEYSRNESLSKYMDHYNNLIILRTLSKAYGLAGIRCGITIANRDIIDLLKKIIAPYPISKPIIEVIQNQLNSTRLQEKIGIIFNEKDKLKKFFHNLSFIKKIWESDANFILFEAHDSKTIFDHCLKHGIVLRDRSNEYNLKNCIRTTVGNPRENAFLMEVLNCVK